MKLDPKEEKNYSNITKIYKKNLTPKINILDRNFRELKHP